MALLPHTFLIGSVRFYLLTFPLMLLFALLYFINLKEIPNQGNNPMKTTKLDTSKNQPKKPSWLSFAESEKADNDFLEKREVIVLEQKSQQTEVSNN